jgi:hypothetical protein
MRVKFATLVGEASRFASSVHEASLLCFFGTRSVPALLLRYTKRPRFASSVHETSPLCFFDARGVPASPNFGRGKEAKRGRFAYRNGKPDVFQPPPSALIKATEAVIRLI